MGLTPPTPHPEFNLDGLKQGPNLSGFYKSPRRLKCAARATNHCSWWKNNKGWVRLTVPGPQKHWPSLSLEAHSTTQPLALQPHPKQKQKPNKLNLLKFLYLTTNLQASMGNKTNSSIIKWPGSGQARGYCRLEALLTEYNTWAVFRSLFRLTNSKK